MISLDDRNQKAARERIADLFTEAGRRMIEAAVPQGGPLAEKLLTQLHRGMQPAAAALSADDVLAYALMSDEDVIADVRASVEAEFRRGFAGDLPS